MPFQNGLFNRRLISIPKKVFADGTGIQITGRDPADNEGINVFVKLSLRSLKFY